jgi:hypothetical protein
MTAYGPIASVSECLLFRRLWGQSGSARHICETVLLTDFVEKVPSTRTAKFSLTQIGIYIRLLLAS